MNEISPLAPAAQASTALPAALCNCTVLTWLQLEANRLPDVGTVVCELSCRLAAAGVPLHRTSVVLRTLHPTIAAAIYIWRAGAVEVETVPRTNSMVRSEAYNRSPIKRIADGDPGIRRRLADPACPRDFPVLDDLDKEGVTDYLALPMTFSDGARYAVSWATTAADGFTDAHLERIAALMPALAHVIEILSVRRIAQNVLETYVGRQTGPPILSGMITRGSRESIDAAIWYSDLRGFTALADRLPTEQVIEFLNDHFEVAVGAIERHGGEVLKFMGDSLLAIFPIKALGSEAEAAAAAIAAYREATSATHAINGQRRARGAPPIQFGGAFHLGEVSYGNIGAPDRLDFTVIGPAVNHAARIESQCRVIERQMLASASFAAVLPQALESLSFHALRGIREPQELFALPNGDRLSVPATAA